MVNISAVRDEEEAARDTYEAQSTVTPVRIDFPSVISCSDAIEKLPAVDPSYILERAEWVDGDSVAVIVP